MQINIFGRICSCIQCRSVTSPLLSGGHPFGTESRYVSYLLCCKYFKSVNSNESIHTTNASIYVHIYIHTLFFVLLDINVLLSLLGKSGRERSISGVSCGSSRKMSVTIQYKHAMQSTYVCMCMHVCVHTMYISLVVYINLCMYTDGWVWE